ncbi:MAG: protein kinase [Pseudomonadota bacterium]
MSPPTLLRFRFDQLLGSGSFGEVWAARDLRDGGQVAVKRLRRADPEALFRFKREFRAVAELHHPNLVCPRELLVEDDAWYLVMDLVEGVDLLTWLDGAPPVALGPSATWAPEAALADGHAGGHPDLDRLAHADPGPEVLAHLETCAACRVERRLALEFAGDDPDPFEGRPPPGDRRAPGGRGPRRA